MSFNWFKVGSELVNAVRAGTRGEDVRYEQDGQTINNLPVAIARTDDNSALVSDGIVRVDSRHYIVEKALLVAGGITDHPHRGTKITESDGTVQTPVSEGTQEVWDWHDAAKTSYRIRCQTIEE